MNNLDRDFLLFVNFISMIFISKFGFCNHHTHHHNLLRPDSYLDGAFLSEFFQDAQADLPGWDMGRIIGLTILFVRGFKKAQTSFSIFNQPTAPE